MYFLPASYMYNFRQNMFRMFVATINPAEHVLYRREGAL
jgi:hypothetical protein